MKIITRTKLPFIAGVIVLCCFINVSAALALENPKVLVLHSYHNGFEWTDSMNSAIGASLQATYPEGDVFVEYMNTKRVPLDIMSPMLRQNYATLFRNAGFNVIITTDNNALDFMLKYGDELFPGVPVVFCGINNFDDYHLSNRHNYTGVREDFDTGATLDIALRFHPGTNTVAMIADVTESSQITLAIARKVTQAKKYGTIRFVELSGLSETALAAELGTLEKGTIILLLSYYRSPEGRVFSVKDGVQLIQKHTQLPVYALWDFYMLPPVIGGKIVTGRLQGNAAGEIAIRILKGEKPAAIPPYSCPTAYYFNYDALQKFNIPEALIPADSIIAGKPDTFYAQYKIYIRVGAAFALCLIATILVLLRSIVLQRRNEAALRTSEEKLHDITLFQSTILDNAPYGIVSTTPEGIITSFNPAVERLLGYTADEMVGTETPACWHDPEEIMRHALRVSGELGETITPGFEALAIRARRNLPEENEWTFIRKDGTRVPVLLSITALWDENGQITGFVGMGYDLTERKLAEQNLAERVMLAELSADIGCAMTMPGDLRNMLNDCAQALVGRLDAAFARIWTLNCAENVLELQASAGMYTRIDGSHSRVPFGSFKIGLIALERTPHLTNEVIGDPRIHDQEWAKREGLVSFAGHPLIIGERLIGVMALFSRHPLTDTTLKALASVSTEIAIGIERKLAEDELHRLKDDLEQRVQERTTELEAKNADLEKMNKLFVGRELRMAELKVRIRELEGGR